jgi:hypothetical protein
MRRGDFSGLYDNQGRLLQLYDPLSTRLEEQANGRIVSVRDPFRDNQIPLSRMSEFAKRIFAITPEPTDITNPLVAPNLRLSVPTNSFPNVSDNPRTIKLDHRFSERDNVFVTQIMHRGQSFPSPRIRSGAWAVGDRYLLKRFVLR